MRAGGVIVKYIPKIHCNNTTPSDHCILFENNDLKIPLKLSGTFSYFYSQPPHVKDLQECDKVFITPDSDNWNPHCEYLRKIRMQRLIFEGEIVKDKRNTNYTMDISDEYDMFQNRFVSIKNLDENIEPTIRNTYSCNPGILHNQLN